MASIVQTPTLHVLCGKLASGKTTLAKQIARETGGVLFSEDMWLDALFPAEIVEFTDYLNRSARFRRAIAPLVRALLERGTAVVFDFAGNVPQERAWARSLVPPDARLTLHYLQASDDVCKRQLRRRNEERPEGSQPTTDAEFDAITRFFVPPDPAEGFD